jgi:hypothetical protein
VLRSHLLFVSALHSITAEAMRRAFCALFLAAASRPPKIGLGLSAQRNHGDGTDVSEGKRFPEIARLWLIYGRSLVHGRTGVGSRSA